jgi:CBS domain-containing protein
MSPDSCVGAALEALERADVPGLAVVDGAALVGWITAIDVVRTVHPVVEAPGGAPQTSLASTLNG